MTNQWYTALLKNKVIPHLRERIALHCTTFIQIWNASTHSFSCHVNPVVDISTGRCTESLLSAWMAVTMSRSYTLRLLVIELIETKRLQRLAQWWSAKWMMLYAIMFRVYFMKWFLNCTGLFIVGWLHLWVMGLTWKVVTFRHVLLFYTWAVLNDCETFSSISASPVGQKLNYYIHIYIYYTSKYPTFFNNFCENCIFLFT